MQRVPEGSEVVRVPVNERLNEKQIKALYYEAKALLALPDVRYRERILSEGILTLIAEVEASEGLRLDYSLLCDDYVQLKTDVEVLRAENEALRGSIDAALTDVRAYHRRLLEPSPHLVAAEWNLSSALSKTSYDATHSQVIGGAP